MLETGKWLPILLCALVLGENAAADESSQVDTPALRVDSATPAKAPGVNPDLLQPDVPSAKQAKEATEEKAELRADEDPLAQQQAVRRLEEKQAEEAAEPLPVLQEGFSWNAYASARLRYRLTGDDDNFWGDGGSRIGLNGQWVYGPQGSLFGWVEGGFDLLDSLDRVFYPGGSESERGRSSILFPRLFYIGWETPNNFLTFGKNWSAYYQVASWTDLMQGAGGAALGVYNAGTDGGPTGTGRADTTLQTRLTVDFLPEAWFEPFKANLQIQKGRPIPQTESLDYGWAVGASTILELDNNYFAGLGINIAEVNDADTPQARAVNLGGDAQAYLLGLRKFTEEWYVAFGAARLLNHEATDEGIYFDGWGGELYAHRRVNEKVWFGGGFNLLRPDADEVRAQEYDIRFGLVELRYTFRRFTRMVYLNYRFEQSRLQSGEKIPDVVTVGARWDFP